MIGKALGHYEIIEPLGAGGMGEVYRAHDTNLKRDVAIKVLPEDLAADQERLARLEREAHLLASLNHPNIASIYSLEESDGTRFLVLELAEGQTLDKRLASGRLEVEEALEAAKQIAHALEAAHEQGIIHRDLKPSNVTVTNDGKVKVLDFGLAKAFEVEGEAQGDLTRSPTITIEGTKTGVIQGTAAYMSPEQARGKPLDKRTDIFSFGCVLYEILTGRRLFVGEDVSDTLASILKERPNWEALPPETPLMVRVLLRRCLRKDPNRRLHDVADARIEIEEALSEPPEGLPSAVQGVAEPRLWGRAIPWSVAAGIAALAALAASVAVWSLMRPAPSTSRPVTRTLIDLAPAAQLEPVGRPFAISPDGTHLVYSGRSEGASQLYLHEMDRFEATPIPSTEGAHTPFFSPDGRWVGFFTAEGKLKKVSLDGGVPLTICDAPPESYGASWGPDGSVIFAPGVADLVRVPASGGIPEAVATPDRESGELAYYWPQILPGGDAVLFTIWGTGGVDEARIAVLSLETGKRKVLLEGGTGARYSPTGHLVYASAAGLLAVPFDLEQLEVGAAPASILDSVRLGGTFGAAYFAFSVDGSLVYLPGGGDPARLGWVDREGKATALSEERRDYQMPRLSPDGKRVAVSVEEGGGRFDIWIHDVERRTLTLLTFEGDNTLPVWTTDGEQIAFASDRSGTYNLFWKRADGSGDAEVLLRKANGQFPTSLSPDGQLLAFYEVNPTTRRDIWVLPLQGGGDPSPFLVTPYNERAPIFSPDGRWLAYVSDESGRDEVYVRPYPGPGGKRQISPDGGTEPLWAPSGRELFYRNHNKMMTVTVETSPEFRAGTPRLLFEGTFSLSFPAFGYPRYDVTPEGQQFLMVMSEEESAPSHLNVVLNWHEELKRLVPTGR